LSRYVGWPIIDGIWTSCTFALPLRTTRHQATIFDHARGVFHGERETSATIKQTLIHYRSLQSYMIVQMALVLPYTIASSKGMHTCFDYRFSLKLITPNKRYRRSHWTNALDMLATSRCRPKSLRTIGQSFATSIYREPQVRTDFERQLQNLIAHFMDFTVTACISIATLVVRYRQQNGSLINVIRRDGGIYYLGTIGTLLTILLGQVD
jgi:hypothetical protein